MEKLDQINFARDIFGIRKQVAPPGQDAIEFATQKGVKIKELKMKVPD